MITIKIKDKSGGTRKCLIPESYKEITFRQYAEILEIGQGIPENTLSVLLNLDKESVRKLEVSKVAQILTAIDFMNTELVLDTKQFESKYNIEKLEWEKYQMLLHQINVSKDISTTEYEKYSNHIIDTIGIYEQDDNINEKSAHYVFSLYVFFLKTGSSLVNSATKDIRFYQKTKWLNRLATQISIRISAYF